MTGLRSGEGRSAWGRLAASAEYYCVAGPEEKGGGGGDASHVGRVVANASSSIEKTRQRVAGYPTCASSPRLHLANR